MAILCIADGFHCSVIASALKVSEESIRLWVNTFILRRGDGVKSKKRPGRPSKLTKTQKRELEKLITEGPAKASFPGAFWRRPMIQSTFPSSLRIWSFHIKSQKAKFVSDHKDPENAKNGWEKVARNLKSCESEECLHFVRR